ncbi:unnamed protein product [Cyclocybe aegerita]|uniref:BHLH domain-containing protein n=1 Tax=Cyclocybe aegerita TaxID=1973307 RepID=A0A8S0WZF7_CYCAE|nr:unnamed protein product [Cyclocybe aegerita]
MRVVGEGCPLSSTPQSIRQHNLFAKPVSRRRRRPCAHLLASAFIFLIAGDLHSAMQSLLTQSESHAFQTFLSSMDYSEDTLSASEWALYNSAPMQHSIVDDSLDSNPEHRQALAKATKDLMSLDPDHRWDSGGDFMMSHQSNMNQRHFDLHGRHLGHYDQQLQHQQQLVHQQQVLQHQQQHLQQQQQQQQRANSYSSPHDSFPFLHNSKLHQQQQMLLLNSQYQHSCIPQQNLLSPLNMNHISPRDSSTSGTPTTPHSPFNFQQQQHNSIPMHHPSQQQQQLQVHIPPHQRDISPSGSANRVPSSQSAPSTSSSGRTQLQQSPPSPIPSSSSSSHFTRSRTNGNATASTSGSTSTSKRTRTSTSPPIAGSTAAAPTNANGAPSHKPALLSPSQKKANHIQSEQKRRANIRRGYEALCETVPALREAIREEEEAERQATKRIGPGVNGATKKKGRAKKGKGQEGQENEKDGLKIDGRAGPRSENVVLSKTIDHIQSLLADRSALLARLHQARSSLPPGHPALTPLVPDPPWEREWKGGEGRLGDEGEAEGEEQEGEGDGDGSGED